MALQSGFYRVEIGDGDWVQSRFGAKSQKITNRHDWDTVFDVFSACLVAWGGPGFCDEQGNPVPLTREALERIDEKTEDAILLALEQAMRRSRQEVT